MWNKHIRKMDHISLVRITRGNNATTREKLQDVRRDGVKEHRTIIVLRREITPIKKRSGIFCKITNVFYTPAATVSGGMLANG